MNQAVVIAVGTELLFGTTLNTDAPFVSQQLHGLGISVLAHYVIGDNPRRLARALRMAFEEADIVITTGGLGPTQDDLTKEVIAEYMGVGLVLDEQAKERLDARMASFGARHYTPNNAKQALLPEGCTPFYNSAGTAPGFALERDGRLAIALPGPPHEMERMFAESVAPFLTGRSHKTIYSEMLTFEHIGESLLETILLPIIDGQSDPTVATYAKPGVCTVRITSMRDDAQEARQAVGETAARARALVQDFLDRKKG